MLDCNNTHHSIYIMCVFIYIVRLLNTDIKKRAEQFIGLFFVVVSTIPTLQKKPQIKITTFVQLCVTVAPRLVRMPMLTNVAGSVMAAQLP